MKLPNVSSKYGAPMGRFTQHSDPTLPYKFSLARVYLDSGGYDNGGAYWGSGAPLYVATATVSASDESPEFYLRARDRNDAKAQVIAKYPNARFYR